MPRYDYRCEAGHQYELVEPFGSPAEHPCQRCGRPAHRVLVAPPLVFKGGGFYKTSGRSGSSIDSDPAPSSGRSKKPPKGGKEQSASESTATDAAAPSSTTPPASTATD